jgi:hypothetical protein
MPINQQALRDEAEAMRIPAEGLARYHVENNRSGNTGAKAVSESAALGAGFPDALPRQRPTGSNAPDVGKEDHRHDERGQHSGADSQQPDRRKEKQGVLIDSQIKRTPDLANGRVIDIKI